MPRGGARPGAGAKKATGEGKTTQRKLSLDDASYEVMLEVGKGNASEGARRLAHDHLKRQARKKS